MLDRFTPTKYRDTWATGALARRGDRAMHFILDAVRLDRQRLAEFAPFAHGECFDAHRTSSNIAACALMALSVMHQWAKCSQLLPKI